MLFGSVGSLINIKIVFAIMINKDKLSKIQLSTKNLQKYLAYTKAILIFFLSSKQQQ